MADTNTPRYYNPNRNADWNYGGTKWKLSRSKIDLFLECPRCFYIDNKLGTKRPNIPSFNLNIAVDELLKKEFDHHRAEQTPHPLMITYGVDATPYQHEDIESWRDPFLGITYKDEALDLCISGAIDDVWLSSKEELIIIDYKATAKEGSITRLSDSSWEQQYERQLAVYQWLFRKNDFLVSDTAYILYCNAQKNKDAFEATLHFEMTLIACQPDDTWIPRTLKEIHDCLNNDMYPSSSKSCEYCLYREATGKKLQSIFKKHV